MLSPCKWIEGREDKRIKEARYLLETEWVEALGLDKSKKEGLREYFYHLELVRRGWHPSAQRLRQADL